MDEHRTRQSFVDNLKRTGSEGWDRFYDFYAPMILGFACKRGCPPERAEDVLQETIVALLRVLPDFDYDRSRGKFRSYLFRIAESKIVDSYRREKRRVPLADPEHAAGPDHLCRSDDSPRQLWAETWDHHLLGQAVQRARERVQPQTFRCFEEVFLNRRSVSEVAKALGLTPNLVSQHKHKVYTLILAEAKRLREEHGE